MRKLKLLVVCVVITLTVAVANVSQAAVIIDTVPVGNAGNAGDTEVMLWSMVPGDDTGYGAVGYNYNIGKYEVTAGQYTEFLNAVAATDTYGLYNPYMWADTSGGCQIQRGGSDGSYTYSVAVDYADRPVNYVSFWDAARFTNWLHNGQGNADTETGAYTLTADGIANNTVVRNSGWQWAVTSEDEWYKAAYYDPNKSGGADYWDYAIKTDTPNAPSNDLVEPTDPGNHATYYDGGYTDSTYLRTEVGAHENSESAYGTFDQGGNVWEWNEAIITATGRGMRGGGYDTGISSYDFLHAKGRNFNGSGETFEYDNLGFRVVAAAMDAMDSGTLISVLDGNSSGTWSGGVNAEGNLVEVNFNNIDTATNGAIDFTAEYTDITGEQLAQLETVLDSISAGEGSFVWVNWSFTLSRNLADLESTDLMFDLGLTGLSEEEVLLWHFDGTNYTPITSALDFSQIDLGVFTAMGITDFSDYTVTIAVPEPATAWLLGLGALSLLLLRRKRQG